MRKFKADHVVMQGKGAICLHCGMTLTIPVPIEIPVFCAMADAFVKCHKNCKLNATSKYEKPDLLKQPDHPDLKEHRNEQE